MADIEEPGRGADGQVLRHNPGELERHLPAAEPDQAGAGGHVLFVQWRQLHLATRRC